MATPPDDSHAQAAPAIVLTRWADVAAALRDPRLAEPGGESALAHPALPADRIAELRAFTETTARTLAAALPVDAVVELMACYAAPLGLALAVHACGAAPADGPALDRLARVVFEHAADATGPGASAAATDAVVDLARTLADPGGPFGVQAFVALAHTLPTLLGGACLALAEESVEQERLRADPSRMPAAVEELLRVAGPSRAVFRDGPTGPVVLRLADANHDPARFPAPERMDLTRGGAGHLALGRGAHSCYGAPLVRAALAAAIGALLRTTTGIALAGAPVWREGAAIRALVRLPVVLHREPGDDAPAAH